MPSEVTPIAVFAFNRPDHLAHCLVALEANSGAAASDVTIFCDGERGSHDRLGVRETKAIAHRNWGFKSVTVVERSRNLGLSGNLTEGISQVLQASETVIVVEDDLVAGPTFLEFMNAGLDMYRADLNVASVHGFLYDVDESLPQSFFLRGADCWGWGTWRRAWKIFNPDGSKLLQELRRSGLQELFDFGGSFPYTKMLQDQIEGRNDSWAVRWYASAFLASMYTLYPGESLVRNIGLEGSGTHEGVHRALAVDVGQFNPPLSRIPISDSVEGRTAFERAFRQRQSRFRSLLRPFRKLGEL